MTPFLQPSSSTTGFFQAKPIVPPQYASSTQEAAADTDLALPRILKLYLPHPVSSVIQSDLSSFAEKVVSPDILSLTAQAETHPPTLHSLDSFGIENCTNPLRTSEGWRRLKDIGIQEGIVTLGYEEAGTHNRRIHQFAKYLLWCGSAALVTCPSAMTDGAVVLLGRHVDDPQYGRVFREARRRLMARNPSEAWTSGQWMTERKGGSDVSGIETVARRLSPEELKGQDVLGNPLGPWTVDGFKWFSSATDADMTILLAQTENGLSAFFAPMKRRSDNGGTVFNGVRIQRLKNKLGTRALPTAELELKGMRAFLLGQEGDGVKEISTILNVTRLHNAVSAVGYWSRGLAISRAYTRVRKVDRGRLLSDVQPHVAWMADETVKYHAAMHLTYFAVALLGLSEQGPSIIEEIAAKQLLPNSTEDAIILLRVLTPLMKAQTALASIHGLRACMESLGGLGYIESNEDPILNIARLYRDANVGAIWEGTTSVMADDLIRVLKGKLGDRTIHILDNLVSKTIANKSLILEQERKLITTHWLSFKQTLRQQEVEQLQWRGRELLKELELTVCGALLIFNACVDRDVDHIEIAKRWLRQTKPRCSTSSEWVKETAMDRKIFLGNGYMPATKL